MKKSKNVASSLRNDDINVVFKITNIPCKVIKVNEIIKKKIFVGPVLVCYIGQSGNYIFNVPKC